MDGPVSATVKCPKALSDVAMALEISSANHVLPIPDSPDRENRPLQGREQTAEARSPHDTYRNMVVGQFEADDPQEP